MLTTTLLLADMPLPRAQSGTMDNSIISRWRVGSDLCRPSRFTRQPGRLWELSFNSQNPGPCLGQEAWLWTIG